MTELYDLHCHSTASDGALSPTALVQRAHQQGVTSLALTDHDTIVIDDVRRDADGVEILRANRHAKESGKNAGENSFRWILHGSGSDKNTIFTA